VIHRLGINALSLNSPFPKSQGKAFFDQFDVIHLHDPPGSFNLAHLPWLSSIKPVFWTLHTMHAFTGNCIYTYGCERHLRHCGNCPQFGKFPLMWLHRDGSRLILNLRRLIYKRSRIFPVCVSEWLTGEARKGILNRFPIRTILNPVDQEAFYPIPKPEAKKRLGIDPGKKTVLFSVAANPLDVRKGTDIIFEAIRGLDLDDVVYMPTAIASESEDLQKALQGVESLPPRHLSTDEELRLHYSAADVVWHPTRADTSTMVGLEAMSCGTPVIAARVGGVPEIVRDRVNGLLIEPESTEQLVEATRRIFSEAGLMRKLVDAAPASVAEIHSLDRFVASHMDAYVQCGPATEVQN
jgi:glycosyltransferase involved in cell wall biosynthesis